MALGWLTAAAAAAVPVSVEVARVQDEVATLRPETCASQMEGYYQDLLALHPDDVDPADLAANAEPIVRGLFAARVTVQERLAAFYADGELTGGCVDAVRRADIASRYLADHVYEAVPGIDPWLAVDGTVPGPTGLHTGDVLVTRATELSSAGIGHLADRDSVFSHNALVYIGDDGQAWVVEAYLERGAIVEPLETFLASGLGRGVVLRHQDPALAARAADAAFHRVADGPHIRYDDRFDTEDPTTLFCSEVPRWAFGALLGLPSTVPFDQTTLPTGGGLMAQMGVEATHTTAPADVLFDPRFAIVGEWRDVEMLGTMRRHDAVMESLLSLVEDDGYQLRPSASEQATAGIGRVVRGTPLLGLALHRRLSTGLHYSFLVTALAMDDAARSLDATLAARLGAGPVPPRDVLLHELDALRIDGLPRGLRQGGGD